MRHRSSRTKTSSFSIPSTAPVSPAAPPSAGALGAGGRLLVSPHRGPARPNNRRCLRPSPRAVQGVEALHPTRRADAYAPVKAGGERRFELPRRSAGAAAARAYRPGRQGWPGWPERSGPRSPKRPAASPVRAPPGSRSTGSRADPDIVARGPPPETSPVPPKHTLLDATIAVNQGSRFTSEDFTTSPRCVDAAATNLDGKGLCIDNVFVEQIRISPRMRSGLHHSVRFEVGGSRRYQARIQQRPSHGAETP